METNTSSLNQALGSETLDLSAIEGVKPKTNKDRSKEHRQRKKLYINTLEEKVQHLEERVRELEAENESLKELVESSKPDPEDSTALNKHEVLINEEKYAYINLPKLLKVDPEKVRFTMIDQTLDVVGDYGSKRVTLIKDCFRTIIDNIMSIESKALFA